MSCLGCFDTLHYYLIFVADFLFLYDFYSYEMGEKLDEIADQYGLKLHRDIEDVVSEEWDGKVGGHFLKEGCKAEWGYMISDINAFRIFLGG